MWREGAGNGGGQRQTSGKHAPDQRGAKHGASKRLANHGATSPGSRDAPLRETRRRPTSTGTPHHL
ncbi:hypothetical protein BO443_80120 [Burkholderia orbicola]